MAGSDLLMDTDLRGSLICFVTFDNLDLIRRKYRVIQEERSIFLEMRLLVIVKKNRMNMCLILNCYWDRAVWIYKYKSIAIGNKERKIV
jgi:hypothetical protein